MALIEKLSIRGIRSFSPDKDEIIEFYTPLTMIVGANGCGKTTVIECLRYALTGVLPPGSRSGQSFVHDPKMGNSSETKASIRLRFRAKDNPSPMIVIRSLQLTQKKTTNQFKALDGVLKLTDKKNGGANSTSLKCSDLDRQLPVLMGVSRAILESVIFCHQEESSWPLQEGAVLKKKFDDIFESARYTKALDVIKATRQELTGKVKEMRIELASLQAHLEAANALQADFNASESKCNATEHTLADLNDKLTELEQQIRDCQKKAQQVEDLRQQLDKTVSNIRELDAQINEKESHIITMDDQDDAELQEMLDKFNSKVERDNKQKDTLITAQSDAAETLQQLHTSRNNLHAELGKISTKLEEQARLISERDNLSSQLARSHNVVLPPDNIPAFLNNLRQKLRETESSMNAIRDEHRSKEDSLTSEISRTQAEQRSTVTQKSAKSKELKQVSDSLTTLRHTIQQQFRESNAAMSGLTESKERADEAKAKLDEYLKNKPDADIQRRIKELDVKITTTSSELAELSSSIKMANENAGEQRDISTKLKTIEADRENLVSEMHNSEALIQILGGAEPDARDTQAIQTAVAEVKRRKADAEAALNDAQKQLATHKQSKAEHSVLLRQASQRQARLDTESAKLNEQNGAIQTTIQEMNTFYSTAKWLADVADDATDDTDIITVLNKDTLLNTDDLPAAIQMLHKEASDLDAFVGIYEGRIRVFKLLTDRVEKQIQKNKTPACPCCKRAMNDAELAVFQIFFERNAGASLETERNIARERQQRCKEYITKLEKLMPDWRRLQDITTDITKAEDEKDTAQQNVREIEAILVDAQDKVEKCQSTLHDIDLAYEQAQRLLTESNRIEAIARDVASAKERLEWQSSASAFDTRSIDEIQTAYDSALREKDDASKQLNNARSELQAATGHLLKLTNAKSETEREYLRKQTVVDKSQASKNEQERLEQRRRELADAIQEYDAKEVPLRQQLQEAENSLKSERDRFRTKDDTFQKQLQTLRSDIERLSRIVDTVETLVKQDWPKKKRDSETQVASTNQLITEMQKEQQQRNEQIQQLQQAANNQIAERKCVEDNIALRALMTRRDELRARHTQFKQKLAQEGGNEIKRQMQELQQQHGALREARANEQGKLTTLKESMRDVSIKLKSSTYSGIQERQRKTLIDVETTHMAATDLDKYWTALDKALMRYHHMKIMEINKIIADLWQGTYKGGDIDGIEIVSGEEGASTRAARSYNYRVAMRKGSTVLDMKGRCSAGQRVLASIVIRLALAETFCINCGILALDEPTTNLDYENKDGLAKALARIIDQRSQQSNFQLIVITHDEDFVNTMKTQLGSTAGFNMPEHYFVITREQMDHAPSGQYYSKIARKDIT